MHYNEITQSAQLPFLHLFTVFVTWFLIVTRKGAVGKKGMSVNDEAIVYCEKHLFSRDIEVDTTLAKPPLMILRTNELKEKNLKIVRASLLDNRMGHSITSAMLFCCFTSLFFFFFFFFFFFYFL